MFLVPKTKALLKSTRAHLVLYGSVILATLVAIVFTNDADWDNGSAIVVLIALIWGFSAFGVIFSLIDIFCGDTKRRYQNILGDLAYGYPYKRVYVAEADNSTQQVKVYEVIHSPVGKTKDHRQSFDAVTEVDEALEYMAKLKSEHEERERISNDKNSEAQKLARTMNRR